MNNELRAVVEYMEKERGIDREILLVAVENALLSASKKSVGPSRDMRVSIENRDWVAVCFSAPVVETYRRPDRRRHPGSGRLGPDLSKAEGIDDFVQVLLQSKGWIGRYGGIGFSTVNCAIRRSVWDRYPFGWAAIMEDKKWQREVTEAGHRIHMQPNALVHHTHVYPLRSLLRRCASEGYGWRTLGERYTFADMASDMVDRPTLRDLAGGLKQRRVRSGSELCFPWLRPMALYWGNHFAKDIRL